MSFGSAESQGTDSGPSEAGTLGSRSNSNPYNRRCTEEGFAARSDSDGWDGKYPPKFDPSVRTAIQTALDSWARTTREKGKTLMKLHFATFLQRTDNAGRRMFLYTDMLRHERNFNRVLQRLIEELLEEFTLSKQHELVSLAKRHAHFRVKSDQLQLFCNTLIDCICGLHDGPDRHVVRLSWETVMHLLCQRFETVSRECEAALARSVNEARANEGQEEEDFGLAGAPIRGEYTRGDLVTSADHQGYLQVSMYSCLRPRYNPVTDGGHKESYFRTRWCELQGQYLYYFMQRGEKPAGLIDLSQCQLYDLERPDRRNELMSSLPSPGRFSFVCHQRESPPYFFIAQGDYDKEQWYARLKQASTRFGAGQMGDVRNGDRLRVWIGELGRHEAGVCRWVGTRPGTLESPSGSDPPSDPEATSPGSPPAEKIFVGVELDKPTSMGHDGSTSEGRLFECAPGCGMIVPISQVSVSMPLDIRIDGEPLPSKYSGPADFQFLAVLGKGAFGRVCKVRDRNSGEVFACKVLQKAALVRESDQRNVRREKSILLNIHHPFIVKLHAVFQTTGRLFLLFTFLSGGEIFFHLSKSQGGFPELRARFYIAEIALAVGHLHDLKIVHRDLKAQNLVLDSEGHVMLTDFGFAKTIDAGERNTTRCGTVLYMAPEIFQQSDEGYSYEVDWWALGVLLFLMLTGVYPFNHPDRGKLVYKIVHQEISFPSKSAGLSTAARDLCGHLLMKDPEARPDLTSFSKHRWFSGFNWRKCAKRQLLPPFVPDMTGIATKYFCESRTIRDSCIEVSELGNRPLAAGAMSAFMSFCDVHRDYKGYQDSPKAANVHYRAANKADRTGIESTLSDQGSPMRAGTDGVLRSKDSFVWDTTENDCSTSPHRTKTVETNEIPREDAEFLSDLNATDGDQGITPGITPILTPKGDSGVHASPADSASSLCLPQALVESLPPAARLRRGLPDKSVNGLGGFKLWVTDDLPCPI
eukprot:Hpha_TRINITY_DN6536_c0_g1::TRINITY_DN6536_c0_g1_i1::g.46011::m.46011